LAIKKSFKKLALNKKGFSSIVGAIFAVLVILSLTTAVFVWSVNQNTNYNNAVRQTTQSDLDRLNEKALADVTAHYVNDTYVTVNGTLQNLGSLAVTVNTLWVVDSTTNQFNSTSPLNITLKAGNTTTLAGLTALKIPLTSNPTHKLLCWFVSSRGNIISQYSLVLASLGNTNVTNNYQDIYQVGNFTNNGTVTNVYNVGGSSTTYANVSQGIGLLAFDFKGFSSRDYGSTQPQNHTLLGTLTKSYLLHQDNYVVFHIILTNFDPAQQNMIINGTSTSGSAIYVLAGQGNTVKFGFWYLVSVTNENGNLYINRDVDKVEYILEYGIPKDVYFYGRPNIPSLSPQVYPLNIMAFGKLGTGEYGQNVPFVSMNVIS
jgi:archaellum component FlaF (FlaF/FlaG flagellin family)